MSSNYGEGATAPSARPITLRIERVPKDGTIRIRLLSAIDGILTHWHGSDRRGRTIPCSGLQSCEQRYHRTKLIWQGFCAAELLRLTDPPEWHPIVFGITDALNEQIEGRIKVGSVWEFWRATSDDGRTVCTGKFVHETTNNGLRRDINFRAAVERMYSGFSCVWGAKPINPPRQVLCPKIAVEEFTRQQNEQLETEKAERAERDKIRSMLDEARRSGRV